MAVRKIKGSWWVDFMHNYERMRKRSPENSMSAAREYEVHLRREVAARGSVAEVLKAMDPALREKPITFAEYAEEWLATYVRVNNRASEQRGKASAMRRHLLPHFGKMALGAIHRRDIEHFKAAKLDEGLNAKTINNFLTMLGKCLRTAQEDGLITTLPVMKWLKKKPVEFDFLTPIESHALLQDRTEPMWSDLVRLALRTGMRRGELMGLEWSAIDLPNRRLTVRASLVDGVCEPPKNGHIRHLPLTDDVVEMLAARVADAGPGHVFRGEEGGPLCKSIMRAGLQRLCRRTGTRQIGWHTLRHTFASQLAMEGVPIITIKELLGHSTIQMTMRYAHLAPSTLADAVPALLRAEERAVERIGNLLSTGAVFPSRPAFSPRGPRSESRLNQQKNAPVQEALLCGASSGI